MTEQEITLAREQIAETIATPGWSQWIVPAIERRVQTIERRILDAGAPPSPDDYLALLRERDDLLTLRDIPADLVQSLHSNLKTLEKRSGRGGGA